MAFGSQVVARATGVLDMDTRGWETGLKNANRDIEKAGKTWQTSVTKYARAAAVGGGLALAAGMKASVGAALEAEKAQAAMVQQLEASGVAYSKYQQQIDKTIQAQSKLAAVDDEEVQGAFTNLVRATGDVNQALKLNQVALDLSRARGMDLAKAAELVGKVANGNTSALSRYGIVLKEGASAQEAIAALQQKFSGQAEAYGKTAQGAADRSKVAFENLGESIGSLLLPIMEKVSSAFAKVAEWAEKNRTTFLALVGVVSALVAALAITNVITSAVAAFKALQVGLAATRVAMLALNAAMLTNPFVLIVAAIVAVGAALVVLYKKSETFRDIVNGVWEAVKKGAQAFVNFFTKTVPKAFQTVLDWVKKNWPLIVAIISGPIGLVAFAVFKFRDRIVGAFKAIGDAITRMAGWVKDKVGQIVGWIKGIPGRVGNIGSLIWAKLRTGWDAVSGWVRGKLSDLVGWFKELPRKLAGLGASLGQALWNELKKAIDYAKDKLSSAGGAIADFFTDTVNPFSRGGLIPGRDEGRDSVLGLLTPGEVVLNRHQQTRLGGTEALRRAGVPGFAQGGRVLPGTSHNYPGKATLRDAQIADLVYRYGWKDKERQAEAVMVVLGESSGRWSAHYTGGGREDSWGGWQINRRAHPQVSVARATDPEGSTTYARSLYGASGWQPWGAWTDGRAGGYRGRAVAAVKRHRQALERAKNADKPRPSGGGGGRPGGRPGGGPPPVSVAVAPPTGGPLVSEVPGWPGTSLNYRTLYGTYWQEDRNRYVAFMPDSALYWRPGLSGPGPLLNVPAVVDEEPGPHIGPLGQAAVGHPFAFPKWNRWWGLNTFKAFTDMAGRRGMSPKELREWAGSNQEAAALIGFTPFNLPPGGDRWPWEPRASTGRPGEGRPSTAGGKGRPEPGGGPRSPNAQRWQHYKRALEAARRIHRLDLDYVYGGGHTGSVPPANGPFDCSAYVSRVLMEAGILRPRGSYVSGDFLPSGGAGMKAGAGKWLTVWTRPGTGRSGHVFLGWLGGNMSEAGGYGAGGKFMRRSTSGFVPSHPLGYQAGGIVRGRGGRDSVPALLTPGEVVLNRRQQGRLSRMTGKPIGGVLRSLGVPLSGRRGVVRAHGGTQVHFHWFDQTWSRGERAKFLSAAKARGVSGEKIINANPFMAAVFGGSATVGGPVHGPAPAAPAAPPPAAGPAPGEEWGLPEEGGEVEAGGDGGAMEEGGAEGPSGPSAAEIEAQIQERLRREQEAIWGARSGFMRELAGNIFSYGPGGPAGGLELGSKPLQAPVVINSTFNQVPEDPFVWLRQVDTAARFAMG